MSVSSAELSKELDAVSNYFVWKSNQAGKPITNKKVQKLAYYSQAWNLVFNDGKDLFSEPIEAWMHGPAIRNLWYKYRKYGYQPISDIVEDTDIKNDEKPLLDEIWRVYGKYDAGYLETLTHSEDPWLNAREGLDLDETSSIVITNDSMLKYYTALNA